MTEAQLCVRAIAAGGKRLVKLIGGGVRFVWRDHVVEIKLEGEPECVLLAFKDKGEDNMSWEFHSNLTESDLKNFFTNPDSFWGW